MFKKIIIGVSLTISTLAHADIIIGQSVPTTGIAAETGINLATVKYHLTALTNRGFLRRDGKGRATSYRAM